MQIFNTLTRQKEEFVPQVPGEYRIYVCGPTVYNYIHIGNARPLIVFDTLRRYLEYRGNKVFYVSNITDIDDKLIKKGQEEGTSMKEVAQRFEAEYLKDAAGLNCKKPTVQPRATEHIQQILDIVKDLIDSGHAYVAKNGDVYFRVKSDPEYGKLSHLKLDDLESGNRELRSQMDDDLKEDPADFAVWKAAKPGEPAWESPYGMGRPGWHIECSAMSHRYLKDMFDIHGGGLDLRFPHHENEMAQTRAAGYDSAARWMHSAWVTAKGEKMSKSLGNGLSVPAVLAEHSAWVVRYALGSVQYRSMLEWSDQTLAEAQSAYDRVANFIERAGAAVGEQPSREEIMAISADALPADFVAAMNDDINVSGASAAIFTAIRSGNTLLSKLADRADSDVAKAEVREALVNVRAMLDTLGLDPLAEPWVSDGAAGGAAGAGADSAEHDALDKLVSEQLAERAEARKAKDFARADAIRDALNAAGIAIEDGPQGSTWSLK